MRVSITYFALLREQRGLSEETLETPAKTPAALYANLQAQYGFSLDSKWVKAAINDEFADMHRALSDGDRLVFIPPVAGG